MEIDQVEHELEGASSESDFPFYEDNLMKNANVQQKYLEMGSSSDLSNVPTIEDPAANLTQSATAFNSPIAEKPQSYNIPTADNAGYELFGEYGDQPQLNFGNIDWNRLQHAYNTSKNLVVPTPMTPQVANTPSMPDVSPYSSNDELIGAPQACHPTAVGMITHGGEIQSSQAEHEANMIYPNQLVNPGFHKMGTPPDEFAANYSTLQNITSNSFGNIGQQLPLNPTFFSQENNTGIGVTNQRPLPIFNQHGDNTSLLPNNRDIASYSPFTLLGPQQLDQVSQMPNAFDPQCQFSMLPSYSPQSFLHHQVPGSAPPNVYGTPQGYTLTTPQDFSIPARSSQLGDYQQFNQDWTTRNSLLSISSMNSRLQEFYGGQQLNQLGQFMANQYHPQLDRSMLSENISGSNQVAMPPYACNPQQYNSSAVGLNSVPPRLYDYKHQRLDQQLIQNSHLYGSMMSPFSRLSGPQNFNQVADTVCNYSVKAQYDNIFPPQYSSSSCLQTTQVHELLNQVAKQRLSYLNSQTQREIGSQNKVAIPNDLFKRSSSSFKERGAIWQERSLLPSNYPEMDITSQTQGNGLKNILLSSPSNTRQVKNAVYDSKFEGFGLPIDPHLRLFSSS